MKMFIKTIVPLCFIFMVQSLNAQLPLPLPGIKPGITLGASFVYSAPQGDFKKAYKFGIGGEIFGGVGWGSTYIIATVGASAFSADSSNNGTLTYVPVKVGIKKFFLLKKLFIAGNLGIASVKNKVFSESAFTADIGAGVKLLGLELGLYYNTFKVKNHDASNSINAKAGFSFSL